MSLRFFKCKVCGNIITKPVDKCDGLMCCGGDNVTELKANTTDAATEKHVPVVKASGATVCVEVGSVAHPMSAEHHIAFICLETSLGYQIRMLEHTTDAKATFALAEGEKPLAVYEYCNLHGLWVAKL